MSRKFENFIFEEYTFDIESKKLILRYSYDEKIHFEEIIIFNFEFANNIDKKALDQALLGTFLMAGVSYYKAFVPDNLIVKNHKLTKGQIEFFQKTYTKGLGEFYFKNKMDPNRKLDFVVAEHNELSVNVLENLTGCLVPIGGGKDSIVTAESLKSAGYLIDTWVVGKNSSLHKLANKISTNNLKIEKTISPKLLELNAEGALNGHIPISAVLGFIAVTSAILAGKKDVIWSNENSANSGNIEYMGQMINHQYSKSLEYETDFQNYIKNFITPSINFFSFLRPLTELRIAEIFCKNYIDLYFDGFSSCNTNFKIAESGETIFWCCKCPKCAFIFAIFSPFIKKDKLIKLFGKNLYLDQDLVQTYTELLGRSDKKPFECVGEFEEVQKAMYMAFASGEFPELASYNLVDNQFDYKKLHPHSMPPEYYELIKNLL